jgi:hypothetical protein
MTRLNFVPVPVGDDRLDCGCLKEAALMEMALVVLGVGVNRDTSKMKDSQPMSDVERTRVATVLRLSADEGNYMSKLLDLI